VADGVEAIAATPHVRADFPTTPDVMEKGVAQLRADFHREGISLQVLHGGEIDLRLLWAIPPEELARLTIAQTGRYLLLEFPYRSWPLALDSSVSGLVRRGITPLLAHPERNPEVQERPARIEALVEAGALVQVTAASLDGGSVAPPSGQPGGSSSSASSTRSRAMRMARISARALGRHCRSGRRRRIGPVSDARGSSRDRRG
jgi:tyrosine-protein phosphatase YwqE